MKVIGCATLNAAAHANRSLPPDYRWVATANSSFPGLIDFEAVKTVFEARPSVVRPAQERHRTLVLQADEKKFRL
jgi:hypothetical protein